ncbi:MAG: FkbM family methyltransferase [Alphaproteobacteria bacterium]
MREYISLSNTRLYSVLKRRFFAIIFRTITRKSCNIFLRGGDIISRRPQIEGTHERSLTKFIDNSAENGFSDFLIDIGANIGLTSCQNGNNFKKVYCFEPNPLCVNILKTNLAISLSKSDSEIFDFALGDEDGEFDLYVPKHNWGGAFVKDGNDYSEDVLCKKDGFKGINAENYILNTVKVKNSKVIFKDLFTSIIDRNLHNGVIKIDVEGFERKVLLAIANTIPSSMNVAIIFENWDPSFDLIEIKDAFKDRSASCLKIKHSIFGTNKSKLRKCFELILFGEKIKLASIEDDEMIAGDIILMVK